MTTFSLEKCGERQFQHRERRRDSKKLGRP
jgi:hypothetical protein